MADVAESGAAGVFRKAVSVHAVALPPSLAGAGMRQRLTLLTAGLLLCLVMAGIPSLAAAAPPPPPLIAVILPRDNVRFQAMHKAFLKGIEDLTTVAGKPRLYVQSPNPDLMSLRNSVRKATALGADLLVVYGTRAATAASQEDFTEPLIFADVFDPVSMGLVPSLQRGGNLITGVCGYAPVQTLLKSFQQTFGPARLGVVVEAKFPAAAVQGEILHSAVCRHIVLPPSAEREGMAAEPCSVAVMTSELHRQGAVAKVFGKLAEQVDVLYLSDLLPTDRDADELLAIAAKAGVPVISQRYGAADRGALISLEADPVEQGELLADLARNIIDGDLPEDLPPRIPRRVFLIVNLATAKQFEIDIPFAVLSQTSRVVR